MQTIYSLLLLLISTPLLAAANITAHLSHNPVSLDESFHLVYEADSSVDGDPDFSVLSKDFEILSSAQSTNMRSINGNWSLKKSWDLTLISKAPGTFIIPSIPFGRDMSPALRVTVKPSGSQNGPGNAQTGKPIFVEVKTDTRKAWIQSEIIYTVRLFSSLRINRLNAGAVETSDPDAIIVPLGKGSSYEASRRGVRYAVYELRYAVYPQHSGTLTFRPFVFEGRIPTGSSQSLFDQFMQTGRLKRMRSDSISVNILPRPSSVPASDWLPAEQVSFVDEWSEDITRLKTGEPVTRTITISAKGQTAEQIRDIKLEDIDGLKQYPDKAVLDNSFKRDGITGTRQIKIAIIPTRAGKYTIPEISIPWWNTRTGKQQVARLPAVTIEATGLANTQPVQPPETFATPAQQTETPQGEPAQSTASSPYADYWPWISLALAVGWIATTILYFRRGNGSQPAAQQAPPPSLSPLEKAVEKACSAADAEKTKDALIAWAHVRWPDHSVNSLADIAQRAKPEAPALSMQLDALNSCLYSPHTQDWDHRSLLEAFNTFKSQTSSDHKDDAPVMEPLYRT